MWWISYHVSPLVPSWILLLESFILDSSVFSVFIYQDNMVLKLIIHQIQVYNVCLKGIYCERGASRNTPTLSRSLTLHSSGYGLLIRLPTMMHIMIYPCGRARTRETSKQFVVACILLQRTYYLLDHHKITDYNDHQLAS